MENHEQLSEKPEETLTPELADRLISVQERQLTLGLQEQEASHRYAMASLEYDSRNRKEERELILKLVTGQRILAVAIIATILIFTGIVLAMGKDAIAIEILKASAFFLAGGSVGWGFRNKSHKREDE